MRQAAGLSGAGRVLRLLALLLAAILVALSVGIGNAEAKKKKPKKQPVNIYCKANTFCKGNSKNNTMYGTEGDDQIDGLTGSDLYYPRNNNFFTTEVGDVMKDTGTTSDAYAEAANKVGGDVIIDRGGTGDTVYFFDINSSETSGFLLDVVDSNGFGNSDGKVDLLIAYNFDSNDEAQAYVFISDYCGSGSARLAFEDGELEEKALCS